MVSHEVIVLFDTDVCFQDEVYTVPNFHHLGSKPPGHTSMCLSAHTIFPGLAVSYLDIVVV